MGAEGETESGGEVVAVGAESGVERGCGGGEVAGDVEVDEASIEFIDGRGVLPAKTEGEGEIRLETPIVTDVEIGLEGAEIFVGVAESDGAGVGDAGEEIGEVVAGGGTGEGEAAAGVLLIKGVELEAAIVAPPGEVVAVAVPGGFEAEGGGLAVIAGELGVLQGGDAA